MKKRIQWWTLGMISAIVLLLFPCWASAEQGTAIQKDARVVTANDIGIAPNDFELLIRAAGNGPNVYGYASMVTFVTYKGAGVTGLPLEMFHISTTPQVVPAGATALVLDPDHFYEWGDGKYTLSVKPFNDGEWKTGTYNMILSVDTSPQYNAGGMTVVVIKNE